MQVVGEVVVWTGSGHEFHCAVVADGLRRAAQGGERVVVQLLKGGIGCGVEQPRMLAARLVWLRPDINRIIDTSVLDSERTAIQALWRHIQEIAQEYDLVILEGAGLAIEFDLIVEEQLVHFLVDRPERQDVVLTGPAIPASIRGLAEVWCERQQPRFARALIATPLSA